MKFFNYWFRGILIPFSLLVLVELLFEITLYFFVWRDMLSSSVPLLMMLSMAIYVVAIIGLIVTLRAGRKQKDMNWYMLVFYLVMIVTNIVHTYALMTGKLYLLTVG